MEVEWKSRSRFPAHQEATIAGEATYLPRADRALATAGLTDCPPIRHQVESRAVSEPMFFPMKGVLMNRRWFSLPPAALLAVAVASPVALAGPTNVPLKASLATQETLIPGAFLPPGDVCYGSFAKGTTTVIGKVSSVVSG